MRRRTRALASLASGRAPGQLVIQITDRCNARCPQCSMRADNRYPRSTLPSDHVRRCIDHAARAGFRMVSLTGGEPFLVTEKLLALIDHATRAGMDMVRTGTNGFMLARPRKSGWDRSVHRLAEDLARTRLRNLWISIDSADPEVHDRIRGLPDTMLGVEKALPIFHEAGVYPSANIGLHRLTGGSPLPRLISLTGDGVTRERLFAREARRSIRAAFNRVIEMGFTLANVCYPMSHDPEIDPVYGAASSDYTVTFTRKEKGLLLSALSDVLDEVRPRIRVFTPASALHALVDQLTRGVEPEHPCRGGADYFFVDARDGDTYPCGYRGAENLGRFHDLDLSRTPLQADCTRCTWECFRDGSHLFGSITSALTSPGEFAWQNLMGRTRPRELVRDVAYALSCDLFDGRRPPDFARLARFGRGAAPAPSPGQVGLPEMLDRLAAASSG